LNRIKFPEAYISNSRKTWEENVWVLPVQLSLGLSFQSGFMSNIRPNSEIEQKDYVRVQSSKEKSLYYSFNRGIQVGGFTQDLLHRFCGHLPAPWKLHAKHPCMKIEEYLADQFGTLACSILESPQESNSVISDRLAEDLKCFLRTDLYSKILDSEIIQYLLELETRVFLKEFMRVTQPIIESKLTQFINKLSKQNINSYSYRIQQLTSYLEYETDPVIRKITQEQLEQFRKEESHFSIDQEVEKAAQTAKISKFFANFLNSRLEVMERVRRIWEAFSKKDEGPLNAFRQQIGDQKKNLQINPNQLLPHF
jgi:hypothetical protein